MESQSKITKLWENRPTLPILIICLFEFLGLLAIPSAIFSERAATIGVWYQIYVGLTSLLTIAIIYFLWQMKKEGIFIYVVAYLTHNIIALLAGNWMVGVLIVPIIGIILIFLSLKHFDEEIQ